MIPARIEAVVIGAGILGLSTAFALGQAGIRTIVVDANDGIARGSTAAATGGYRLQFDDADEIALVRESLAVYERFGDAVGLDGHSIGYRPQGYLWAATTESGERAVRETAARQRALGIDDIEVLDGDEARRRFPHLSKAVRAARFRAGDGFFDPLAIAAGYARAARASFAFGRAVTRIDVAGDRVRGVETDAGRISCDHVVVCAGSGSGALLAGAGANVPLEAVVRRRLVFPALDIAPQDAPMTIDDETGAHWRPAGGGAFVLGPSELDGAGYYADLLDPQRPASVASVTPFWREVWRHRSDVWHVISGHYTMTPDRKPFLGATPIAGLWLNCGDNGHGVMSAPARARIVSDAMLGRISTRENPFRFDRTLAASKAQSVL